MSIDIYDDELLEILDRVFSGCLPHENYNSELFTPLVTRFLGLFEEGELTDKFYVFANALNGLIKLRTAIPEFVPVFTRDILDKNLTNSVYELIFKKEVGMERWLQRNGLDSNLKIQMVAENAASKLYTNSLEYYDKLFEMKVSTNESISLLPTLMEKIIANLYRQGIRYQVEIEKGNFKWERKVYSGAMGGLDFMRDYSVYMKKRSNSLEQMEDIFVIDSIEKKQESFRVASQAFKPLCNIGIEPIDKLTPITQHSYVVLVGVEGLGKTHFAVQFANNVIENGKDVIFMTGESTKEFVNVRKEVNWLYSRKGYCINKDRLLDLESLDDPVAEKAVRSALVESLDDKYGKMRYRKTFCYDTFEAEVDDLMVRFPNTGAIILDHSGILGTSDKRNRWTMNEKVEMLSRAIIEVKKKYPIAVMLLSHPGSKAKKDIAKGYEPEENVTAYSNLPSRDADYVFILSATEEQKKQGLMELRPNKMRNFRSSGVILMNVDLEYSSFTFEGNADDALAGMDEIIESVDDEFEDEYEDEFDDEYSMYDDDDFDDVE